jgi:hypothetical protein
VKDLFPELDAVNQGTLTLQTMAFEPATKKLHLSIGRIPSSKGPVRTLELRELFRRGKDVADRR